MKFTIKEEKDPIKALKRIADYLGNNYPEGTSLYGNITAYFNLQYDGDSIDRDLEIMVNCKNGEVTTAIRPLDARGQAIEEMKVLWKEYQEVLDKQLEKYNYAKVLADRYIISAEKKIRYLGAELSRMDREKDYIRSEREQEVWKRKYSETYREKSGAEKRLKNRRFTLEQLEGGVRDTQQAMLLYRDLKNKSYEVRTKLIGDDKNKIESWSVWLLFQHEDKSYKFCEAGGLPHLWECRNRGKL